MYKEMNNKKILCPFTGVELIYVYHDEGCMDGSSYYSPINDASIIYAVWPRRNNIYSLVDSKSSYAKELRYFKLEDDYSWIEMKRVPHGDSIFPINYFGSEWKKACIAAEERYKKRLEKEKYWEEHPEEDPRIRATTISADEVKVMPMGPPSATLFYLDFKYKEDE